MASKAALMVCQMVFGWVVFNIFRDRGTFTRENAPNTAPEPLETSRATTLAASNHSKPMICLRKHTKCPPPRAPSCFAKSVERASRSSFEPDAVPVNDVARLLALKPADRPPVVVAERSADISILCAF